MVVVLAGFKPSSSERGEAFHDESPVASNVTSSHVFRKLYTPKTHARTLTRKTEASVSRLIVPTRGNTLTH